MTRHTRKPAIETTVGDIIDAIDGIAASVNARVPSGEHDLTRPRAAESGEDERRCPRCGEIRDADPPDGCMDYFCPIYVDADEDEDAELPGDPPLFDAPLTDRQEAAAYHIEEYDNEGWINEEGEE